MPSSLLCGARSSSIAASQQQHLAMGGPLTQRAAVMPLTLQRRLGGSRLLPRTHVLVPGRSSNSGSDSRGSDDQIIRAIEEALDKEIAKQKAQHLEELWHREVSDVVDPAVEPTRIRGSPINLRGITDITAIASTSGSTHPEVLETLAPAVPAVVLKAASAATVQEAETTTTTQQHTNNAAADMSGPQQPSMSAAAPAAADDNSIPQPVIVISCISASLTLASCVFNTALPIYMVSELKMSMASMGMFEGILEAFSYVVRMLSGVVSDLMTSRKAAITLGFAMGACAKFGMASASSVFQLFASKAIDRLANGVQAAPRDALIGDLSPASARSACFGLAQSLRKWGSMVGALLCFFLMKASDNNYKMIFFAAAGVSLLSCLAFVALVPAHARPQTVRPEDAAKAAAAASSDATKPLLDKPAAEQTKQGFSLKQFFQDVKSMGADYYRMLAVICLYALGHINESLLEARAIEVGFGKAESTLVIAALCCVTFLVAYPLGRLDDKFGARVTFGVGMGSLIAGHLTMMLSGTYPMAVFGACIFLGAHWAVIQGPLLSIMVGLAPQHLRGTAFGIFYTVMALAALAAGRVYGTVWHTAGANAAFGLSAGFMSVALLALPWLLPGQKKKEEPKLVAATA